MDKYNLVLSNSHTNSNSEIKLTSIVNILQDIEGLHIANLGRFTKYLDDNKLGIFLMYRQIDIFKKPKFNDLIKITTHPFKTNIISGYRHIYIKDENDKDLVKSISFGAFVSLETQRPVRMPREIIKSFKDGKADLTMEHLPRKIKYEKVNGIKVDEVVIKKSHIDRYGHLNNAYYVEFAVNQLRDINKYNRIRAEYMKPFFEGEVAYLTLYKQKDDKLIIELTGQSKIIHAVIEFSKINA